MFEDLVAHIFTGFTDVVAGLHMSAVHTPSILDIAKYLIIFVVAPLTAVIAYDQFFPILEGVNLYLVLVILTPTAILTPVLVFALFRFIGGHWLVNWHLRKTSRYLDFCRLPQEYTELLLPKDTVYQMALPTCWEFCRSWIWVFSSTEYKFWYIPMVKRMPDPRCRHKCILQAIVC